jgi:hypothetical protein
MIAPLHDEFLLIEKDHSFLIIAKARERFALCIETAAEELCQTMEPEDLVAVSGPEGGDIGAGVMLIELVRRYHTPLLVLPKGHPASRQLRYVVSAGPVITTSCSIIRGTHPEQHLICASEELSGITVKGVVGGVEITDLPENAGLSRFQFRADISFFEN